MTHRSYVKLCINIYFNNRTARGVFKRSSLARPITCLLLAAGIRDWRQRALLRSCKPVTPLKQLSHWLLFNQLQKSRRLSISIVFLGIWSNSWSQCFLSSISKHSVYSFYSHIKRCSISECHYFIPFIICVENGKSIVFFFENKKLPIKFCWVKFFKTNCIKTNALHV